MSKLVKIIWIIASFAPIAIVLAMVCFADYFMSKQFVPKLYIPI